MEYGLNQKSMNSHQTILLVEDDVDDQLFFSEALHGINNVSLFAVVADGVEAIKLLQRSTILPSLIIMDINMPRMNGMECLVKLKANDLTRNIPVILLSTSSAEGAYALSMGAAGFYKKSWDSRVLHQQLEKFLNPDASSTT